MLTKSRITLAAALAAAALGAPPALAGSVDPATGIPDRSISEARGEYAASRSDHPAEPTSAADDQRSPDAVEPFVRPVVVEVSDPGPAGFDWTAAIIGLGAGLALAVLAGVGVSGGRRRHTGASTS